MCNSKIVYTFAPRNGAVRIGEISNKMAKASDIKNGNILRFNGELTQVEEFLHRTPGNLRAFYQAKMRNVKTGKLVEYRFSTNSGIVYKPFSMKIGKKYFPTIINVKAAIHS